MTVSSMARLPGRPADRPARDQRPALPLVLAGLLPRLQDLHRHAEPLARHAADALPLHLVGVSMVMERESVRRMTVSSTTRHERPHLHPAVRHLHPADQQRHRHTVRAPHSTDYAPDTMALITSDLQCDALPEHQMALITSDCELRCAPRASNGPNHLGLRRDALPAHQTALITSDCDDAMRSPSTKRP